MIRALLSLLFLAASFFLGYKIYESIKERLDFATYSEQRKELVTDKLKTIRDAQLVYRENHSRYASTFDSLKMAINTEHYNVLKKIGDPNDTTIVSRVDTLRIPIIDSLFKGDASAVAAIDEVPSGNGTKFLMESGFITKNEIELPAFEVKTQYKTFYDGLELRYYWDTADDYIQVGSLEDGTTGGNWTD